MPHSEVTRPTSNAMRSHDWRLPLVGLLLWLVVAVPLFVRMPLTNDTEVYDLQASAFRHGSVLYRDFLEPNLPGVIWVHLGVRAVLGESSEAMRVFDLLVLAGISGFAAHFVQRAGGTRAAYVWTVWMLTAFYLTASEWCHCQRDVWMLLPVLDAISVRLHAFTLTSTGPRWGWAFLEGLLWGGAVWIKPHVIIPGALVWLVTLKSIRSGREFAADLLGLLSGGLVMGGIGVAWMMSVGCWQPFVETLQEWNPAYFRAGREHWTLRRFLSMVVRQGAWSLLPPLAALVVFRSMWRSWRPVLTCNVPPTAGELLGALFVGWCVQAGFLQHLFDYVFAPVFLLAILLSCVTTARETGAFRWGLQAALALVLCWVGISPAMRWDRVRCWSICWQRELSPAQRDQLALLPNPVRDDLAQVASFLQRANVSDRDVCFYNSDFVSLYRQLGLLPPVRYTYFFETMQFFPEKRNDLLEELQQQSHRYVVTDLVSVGMPRRDAEAVGPAGPHAPPPAYRRAPINVYPWSCPVVYRAGTYLIHQVPTAASQAVAKSATDR